LIPRERKEELNKLITGILHARGCHVHAVNNEPDHVHIVFALNPKCAISDLMRDVKAGTSKTINEQKWTRRKFGWQANFAAYSVSHSVLPRVIQYVMNQEEHHRQKLFREEFLEFLEAAGLVYDTEHPTEFVEGEQAALRA
jgi:putative transposase